MEQSKEFLVDMLGHVAGVNALATLRDSPGILDEFGLAAGAEEAGSPRKLALSELTKNREKFH